MQLLHDLEKNGKQRYEEILPFMRQKGLSLNFETRSGLCTFVDDMKAAGVLLYLFKITAPLEETLHFLKQTPPSLEGSENAKRIILLDDMDKIQWSAEQFGTFTQAIDEHLRATCDTRVSWHIIPICTTSGENVLEISSRSPWYKAQNDTMVRGKTPCTVIDALDA